MSDWFSSKVLEEKPIIYVIDIKKISHRLKIKQPKKNMQALFNSNIVTWLFIDWAPLYTVL